MANNPYAPPKSAVLEAASDEGELILDGRKVEAGRGKAWFGEAWSLFKLSPGIWIVIFILFMVASLVLAIIPGGSLLSYLFMPAVLAGLMIGCRDLEAGQPLLVGHLFAGFKHNVGNLVLVGLLYLVGLIVVSIIAVIPMVVVMTFLIPTLAPTAGVEPDFATMMWVMLPLGLLFVALVIALSLPLVAALWYAPALVVFHDVQPWPAMKASLRACMRNWVPMLVYSLVALGLMILALIPLGLGLLVFGPLMWASMYTGYRDIFIRPT